MTESRHNHEEGLSSFGDETYHALEWDRVLDTLALGAQSAPGAIRCRALTLEDTLEGAAARLTETSEMLVLRSSTDPFPSMRIPDLDDVLVRASKGGALDALELRDIAGFLRVAEDVARYGLRHQAEAPSVAAITADLPAPRNLSELRADIEWVVDADGTIKDSASPELRRLTQQVHDLKQAMRRRLESILQSHRYEDVLQERYFAQREGRYVVPIKTEKRGVIPGIVHDISASGATVFLEPRELVELNNGIKVGELAVEREVRRILQELSIQVGAQAETLREAQAVLVRLDVIQAKAALAVPLHAGPVHLNDCGRIRLRNARHPLLALSRPDEVVANDVVLDDETQVMVISGANTGGKTVTLKLVGLFALMVRAGLLVPCEAGSEMALFPSIYADIGDAQDLAKDLSSFSSHVMCMIRLLDAVSARSAVSRPEVGRWLVLLDEPMTSTDPAEGAALAQALLARLADLRVKAIVTTHYTELKVLAQASQGFVNASVEFDVTRLAPTYRLIIGIPGGSSAIEIAGRLGLDESLLEAARDRLKTDELALEQLLSDVQSKQRRVTEDLLRAESVRREAEAAAREALEITARVRDSEAADRRHAKKRISEELQRARAAIQGVIDELKTQRTVEKAKAAKAKLASVETDVSHMAPPQGGPPVESLGVGDQVEVKALGVRGVLLEAAATKARVRIRVGSAEMSVPVGDLLGLARQSGTASSTERPQGSAVRSGWNRGGLAEPEVVVDVRGRAADDALDQVVAQLDSAALGGAPYLRIIHGHGTGKLRAVLRDYLKASPYVSGFRPGDRSEGGDGVTIVELTR
ncbi:endonuclease MutS2 [Nitrospira sp.]|nr:endonuclease MutS2 [Nitrospira sp.]